MLRKRSFSIVSMSCFMDRARRSSFQTIEGVAAAGVFKRFAKGRAIRDRARHLLDENLLAPRLFERVLLQGKVLVERRNAGVADLVPWPVNFAVLSRPCVALRLVARGRLPPFSRRGAPGLGRLCRHWLSLTTRLDNELLRDRNQERLLRDDFAGFEALPASGRASLKKDPF